MSSENAYQVVADRILEHLRNGVAPWRKTHNFQLYGWPRNYIGRNFYRGMNSVLLSVVDAPYFGTLHQWTGRGYELKRGAKPFPVVFFKVLLFDGSGNIVETSSQADYRIPYVKLNQVYHILDVRGFEMEMFAPEKIAENTDIESCRLLVDTNVHVTMLGRPRYDSTNDIMYMPDLDNFTSAEDYYKTKFHELVHWTGHKDRLNRFQKFQKYGHAFEELVAELGSTFLCNEMGILRNDMEQNNAAYIGHYIAMIENWPETFALAAREAERATKFIIKNSTENGQQHRMDSVQHRQPPHTAQQEAPGDSGRQGICH